MSKMGRPDKMDRLPAFLQAMLDTPSIAKAARAVGLSTDSVYRYIVRSRMGDEALQRIPFCDVEAPFHIHLKNHVPALVSTEIEMRAMDRALNGIEQDVFYQGVRMHERVRKPQYAHLTAEDIEAFCLTDDELYETVPTKQHLKPSDALTLRMLEAWNGKRYRPTQEIGVTFGGVLRLERPDERAPKTIEHQPVFEEADESNTEQRGGHLALARPATSSEELDKWAQQGEFEPAPVKFVDAKGNETVLQAPERSDITELRRLAKVPPKNPRPSHPIQRFGPNDSPPERVGSFPEDVPATPSPVSKPMGVATPPSLADVKAATTRAAPLDHAGVGRGRVPDGGFRVR